ncbi:hypothetical protein ACS8Y6_02980 [Salinisphaera sp. RV14]|uniref:hypothetical protein n=1 Tax=unclassified Salinisphaera TaxID=2649847 RepID=UPI003F85ECDB
MKRVLHSSALAAAIVVLGASLQGCVLAAGAAAGAAGGYEAKKHGYDVQSPVKKDSAGGYKGQSPVVKHPQHDTASSPRNSNDSDDAGDGTSTRKTPSEQN